MSFAQQFALGQQIAQNALDTYDRYKQRREVKEIMDAQPQYSEGYTAQDGEQLRALANAKDPSGKAYYNLEASPDGGYKVTPNFQVQNAAGELEQAAPVNLGMRRVADFRGQRYDAESLTPDRLEGLRARALADTISRTDPIRGLGLRQQIKAGEREDKRFDWETEDRPLKQRMGELQVKGAELGIKGAERTDRQGERAEGVQSVIDEAMKMPLPEVEALAGKLNTNDSPYPLLYTGKTKDGYTFVTTDANGNPGPQVKYTESQVRQLVAAQQLGAKGFGQEAMGYLEKHHSSVADMVKNLNTTTGQVVQSGNQAKRYSMQDQQNAAELELRRRGLDIQQQQANTTAAYYKARTQAERMGSAQYFTGEDNNTYAVIPRFANGNVSFETVKVNPEGIRMAKPGSGSNKPVDVKEEGTKVMVDGRLMFNDGNGGYIPADRSGNPAGVMPSQRKAVLQKAGVPDNFINQLPWSLDGTSVGYRGRAYDVSDPKELKTLREDIRRYPANDTLVDELQKQHGVRPPSGQFGPKITFAPDPDAPSIYAGEEPWAAYHQRLQNR